VLLSGVTALAACSTLTAPKQPEAHPAGAASSTRPAGSLASRAGDGLHSSEYQWRSGLGVTADGALVYVVGPVLTPLMLADLLVRAGAVRGIQLDINPTWPVFASFTPATPEGLAAPSNGARLVDTSRGPATFFDPTYARDFITMSARPVHGSR
jgi:hypothetical protein